MSLLDLLDVPAARSARSTATTRRPRLAASRATPAPVAPIPTTSTSNAPEVASAISAGRWRTENGRALTQYRLLRGRSSDDPSAQHDPYRGVEHVEVLAGVAVVGHQVRRRTLGQPGQPEEAARPPRPGRERHRRRHADPRQPADL